ncbi:ABC transporter ATP-binding protein [Desulfovibrio inopinatus]|uniref:ABC transporter ATP-binding protein n=1 Tax=Desulfovibrio inopinatus TaxID=102109 RepID=UPI00041C61C0|nr:ABC transporter ATP-binding protein [Desulfovibrio inopinatus]
MDKRVVIKGIGVKKSYLTGEVVTEVLRGVNFEIVAGDLTVILGASGSGKTTLLNLIGGIDQPTEGQILFNGEDISQFSERRLTDHRRNRVGFVFQFYNLVPTLTALENVLAGAEIVNNAMDPRQALEMVGLGDRENFFPAQLSGGQQQRVSIARALAKRPEVMFCDEPTGALDASTGRLVLDLLCDLNTKTGTSIVIVTHATPIAKLAHHVLHLQPDHITCTTNTDRLSVKDIAW